MEAAAKFGLGVPNGGDFANPARLVELAVEAEAAGWDGFFVWDHVIRRHPWKPMVDPWVVLGAVASATERMIIGPMITPLARRRVSVVARQTATLDVLSEGRLRLGVGLGAPEDEFFRFGEDPDAKVRAAKLDESLEALELLWTGEEVSYRGDHVVADGVEFLPRPVNGRVPVWVAGSWPGGAPFRRVARFDGVWPVAKRGGYLSVDEFGDCVARVGELRGSLDGYDAVYIDRSSGPADAQAADKIRRLTDVGMTWWIDSLDNPKVPFETHRERAKAGPPPFRA